MLSNIPKLDGRTSGDILEQVKNMAKQYTPEWNFDEYSSDVGIVFSKIFCDMLEGTISRYNKTSYNYYLTFLNMLGTKLRPASSAEGMITVSATRGAYIPKNSQLSANADTEEGSVIYETTDSLLAINTAIKGVFYTDGLSDTIVKVCEVVDDSNEKMKPFRIFDDVSHENLQCHELYFRDDTIFNMKKSDITFLFYNEISEKGEKMLPDLFSDKTNVKWQYSMGENNWVNIKNVEKVDHGVRLIFENKVVSAEAVKEQSRFIRCVFKKALSEEVAVTRIEYKSNASNMTPDDMTSEDEELDKNDFFPFKEQYNLYDCFYFSSEEAFTKRGAEVSVEFDLQFVKIKNEMVDPAIQRKYRNIMSGMDFADMEPSDVMIEKVSWEYWNGTGWAKLTTKKEYEELFKIREQDYNSEGIKKVFKFVCPANLTEYVATTSEGFYIRARITKILNQFNSYADYISPYIHNINITYDYPVQGHICKSVMVKNNMEEYPLTVYNNGAVKIFKKTLYENPAMYFCFTEPLIEGTIRFFVDIQEGIYRYNPSTKWEYCADDKKGGFVWKHIDVLDLTEDFSHSETITMIGRKDFKEVKLFGETGYFIRVINPDGRYHTNKDISTRPVINNIMLNAVRVVQRDTHTPEYFSIVQNEANKVCQLSYPNAANIEVWVDEFGALSTSDQEKYLALAGEQSEPEYDDLGMLRRLWIKWKPVSTLICTGMYDRVYEVDYSKGEVLFGDGKNGKIPPEQFSESIRINYSVCNGSYGNIQSEMITDFMEAIPGVSGVKNPEPIMGGVDKETIDRAASRMFGQVAGANRLVSLSDFESTIKYNDRNIYKVKCKAHVDQDSNPCLGIISVAVLPRDYMQGYEKFQGIKNRIWKFVDEKASINLVKTSKIRIFEVKYVETVISIDVSIRDFNMYQDVHKGIRRRLQKFLNPITGNFSGKGWNIGEFPRKEFIYNYIKNVPNIKWIKNINIFTKVITEQGKKEVDFEKIRKESFVVPIFGEPEINISMD